MLFVYFPIIADLVLFSSESLTELVNYLISRREAILNTWHIDCEKNPTLGKVSPLSREEFNNLLPIALDILEHCLLDKP
jgi:hypothetical protein